MLLLMLGCTEPVAGDPYEIVLNPYLPLNQGDLFDTVAELSVELRDADGNLLEGVDLGGPTASSLSAEGPTFTGASARLVGRTDGAAVAWGETEYFDPAGFDEDKRVERSMLVGSAEGVGWLQPTAGRYGAAMAALGGGQFWLAGGQELDTSDPRAWPDATDQILSLSLLDSGLAFAAAMEMPGYPDPTCTAEPCDTVTARTGHTLTRLGGADEGRLLLAGGAAQWRNPFGYNGYDFVSEAPFITNDAQIYDPEAGQWEPVTHGEVRNAPWMPYRAFHIAVPMQDGGVVLWGGYSNDDFPCEDAYLEVLPTGSRALSPLPPPESAPGPLWAAGSVTNNGAVICGGLGATGEENLASVEACMRVVSATTVETFDALPKARAGHAMVTLPDGRILLAGGAELPAVEQLVLNGTYIDGHPASADIMVYAEGQGWQYYPNKLSEARAGHAMALLPDGRVLVYGGLSHLSVNALPELTAGVLEFPCAEVLDPETLESMPLDGCPEGVYRAEMAVDPLRGAVAAGGMLEDGVGQGVAFYPGGPPQ